MSERYMLRLLRIKIHYFIIAEFALEYVIFTMTTFDDNYQNCQSRWGLKTIALICPKKKKTQHQLKDSGISCGEMTPSCYCHKKCFHMRSRPPFGPKAMKRQKNNKKNNYVRAADFFGTFLCRCFEQR